MKVCDRLLHGCLGVGYPIVGNPDARGAGFRVAPGAIENLADDFPARQRNHEVPGQPFTVLSNQRDVVVVGWNQKSTAELTTEIFDVFELRSGISVEQMEAGQAPRGGRFVSLGIDGMYRYAKPCQ